MRSFNRGNLLSRLSVAMIVIQSAACASAPANSGVRPDWVDSSSARDSHWKRTEFVSAVGSGSTRSAAESAAKRAVAESLRMDVRSKTTRETKSQLSQDTSEIGRAHV